MKKHRRQWRIPRVFRIRKLKQPIKEQILTTNDPRTLTVEQALSLYTNPNVVQQHQISVYSLTIEHLSDDFYHTGIKETEGAFFKGDECQRIISVETVGRSSIFYKPSEIAILEWKTRPNGKTPVPSGELLSRVKQRHPELFIKYQQDKSIELSLPSMMN